MKQLSILSYDGKSLSFSVNEERLSLVYFRFAMREESLGNKRGVEMMLEEAFIQEEKELSHKR